MKNLKKAISIIKEHFEVDFETLDKLVLDTQVSFKEFIDGAIEEQNAYLNQLYTSLGVIESHRNKRNKKIECTEDVLSNPVYLGAIMELEDAHAESIPYLFEVIRNVYEDADVNDSDMKLAMKYYSVYINGSNIDKDYANKILKTVNDNIEDKRLQILKMISSTTKLNKAMLKLDYDNIDKECIEYALLDAPERELIYKGE